MYQLIIFITYLSYLIIMSIVAFLLFRRDKRLALENKIRIKEKTLLGVTILGGAVGAFLGRLINHHKTNKLYFSIIIYLGMLLELSLLVLFLLLAI